MNASDAASPNEIDAQYDLRAAFPDYEHYFAQWREDSDRARQCPGWTRNIPYGADPRTQLDIFVPPGPAVARPVHVFFHGGYWRALSKDEFSFVALLPAPTSIVTVVVNYPLCPEVTIDHLVEQCRRAIDWIGAEIAGYGGDPERIYVSGHSAGGHITALLLLTDWPARRSRRIRGGLAISGIFNLEPIRRSYLQVDLRLTPEQVTRNSPQDLLGPVDAMLAVAVGAGETAAFQAQSHDFTAAQNRVGNRCELVIIPGAHHYSILDGFLDRDHPLAQALLKLMSM